MVFLACVHLALFLALSLSPGNSLVSSWYDHSMLVNLVSCPYRVGMRDNPVCISAISVSVFNQILSSMIRRRTLLACETRHSSCSVIFALCSRSPFLGNGINVENVHSSGHSPVSQLDTHILCILSSTVSPPPALNSSAGTSSRAVGL